MKFIKRSLFLSLFAVVSFTSCNKKIANKTTCTSVLHGYTAIDSNYTIPQSYVCNSGVIDMSTAVFTGSGTFKNFLWFTNQAAILNTDNSYLTFASPYVLRSPIGDTLFKVAPSGSTSYYLSSDTAYYTSLVYNPVSGKFYAIRNGVGIVSLSLSGSYFTTTPEATPVHPAIYHLTVDNITGDMYYFSGGLGSRFIEKLHPGGSTTSIITSFFDSTFLFGLQFNKNDNKLYCMKTRPLGSSYSDFIKVDPTTGATTLLSSPSFMINPEMYSTVIDPCSNRYLISTNTDYYLATNIYKLVQLNMSGAIVQSNTTPTFYQGLAVH